MYKVAWFNHKQSEWNNKYLSWQKQNWMGNTTFDIQLKIHFVITLICLHTLAILLQKQAYYLAHEFIKLWQPYLRTELSTNYQQFSEVHLRKKLIACCFQKGTNVQVLKGIRNKSSCCITNKGEETTLFMQAKLKQIQLTFNKITTL